MWFSFFFTKNMPSDFVLILFVFFEPNRLFFNKQKTSPYWSCGFPFPFQRIMHSLLLAGRTHAVNREFVYIDFDDERFPSWEMRFWRSLLEPWRSPIPGKSAKSAVVFAFWEPHGIPKRIHSRKRKKRQTPKTQHPVQNRPWVPHAGGQDYGSLHKLPQIIKFSFRTICCQAVAFGTLWSYIRVIFGGMVFWARAPKLC